MAENWFRIAAMTPRRCVAAMAPLIGAVWGCGASTEKDAEITSIVPATAFNDVGFPVSIVGGSFRPIYRFDTMAAATQEDSGSFSAALLPAGGSDAESILLGGVTWQSPKALAATVPAGVPAGSYDVVVTDPRGSRVQLDGAFVSLGPDTEAPSVRLDSPVARSLIAGGTTVTVTLVADDGEGFLGSLGATIAMMGESHELVCTVAPVPHQAPCTVQLVAPVPPAGGALVVITPHALDTAGNRADTTAVTFRLVPRPTLVSVSPGSGPATGGTEIVVEGADFVEPGAESDGSRLLIDGQAIQIDSISASTIHAVMPRHDPGVGAVSVANGDGATEQALPFQFIPAPVVRLAFPLKGPLTGGTRIAIAGNDFRYPETRISIGGVELACATYLGPLRIEGVVPRGMAPGPVWIAATDDTLHTRSTLSDPFVYEQTAGDSPDGGVDPATCAGPP
jgi:hypothetical protein